MSYEIRRIFIENASQARSEFEKIKATKPGSIIMADKFVNYALKVKGLDSKAANILKQEMLARGGDAATARDALYGTSQTTDAIIIGNINSIKSLIEKLKSQPFGLKELSKDLKDFIGLQEEILKDNYLKIAKKSFNLKKEIIIMGILNTTPDSFFDGGKYTEKDAAFKRIDQIAGEGAHIIDIGGMSTRPGSKAVSIKEETERTVPFIKYAKKHYDILISIDTYRSEVAQEAILQGADMVNDISAFTFDEKMASLVLDCDVSAVLMHIKGTPENMQDNPVYEDVIGEIYAFLKKQTSNALNLKIKKEKLIIDPGLGFGKTCEHNFLIISKIDELKSMGFPVLIGASRKSFIGRGLNLQTDERLEGSLAAAALSVFKGANILRVHDVKETLKAVSIAREIRELSNV